MLEIVAGFYREMAEASAQIVVCGQSTTGEDNAKLVGGGRPGDVATPAHWNVVVNLILTRLVPSWLRRGFGFRYESVCLLVLCWADDFTFAAAGIEQLRTMLDELAATMYEHGMQLKASKCKWFANASAWEALGVEAYSMRVDIDAHFGSKVGYSSPVSHISSPFFGASLGDTWSLLHARSGW